MRKKKKVVVAMSGGVDSSVAAYLLKEQGYDVIGISMKLYQHKEREKSSGCCSPEDFEDARRVAEKIGIPFYVLNLEESFKSTVIDYFIHEYENGRTPNPCVMCNEKIKFDVLLKKGLSFDADYVATGHYAKIIHDPTQKIYKAKDSTKDQTYFLFSIQREYLKRILFPLGDLLKSQVRTIALEQGFITALKKESQEICFVTDDNYKKFLDPFVKKQNGEIVHENGEVLGHHEGFMNYTKGQRRGLKIAHPEPLFVKSIDVENNKVVVAERESLNEREFKCSHMNWLDTAFPLHGWEGTKGRVGIFVKTRYRQKLVEVSNIEVCDDGYQIKVKEPVFAITKGQAAVFYKEDQLIGGGWVN